MQETRIMRFVFGETLACERVCMFRNFWMIILDNSKYRKSVFRALLMLKFYLTPLFCVRIYTHKHIHDTREEVSTKKSPSLGIKIIFSKTIRK